MAATFNWVGERQAGSTGTTKFRVKKAQFGDGYRQTVADGLNNRERSWPLVFKGDMAYLQPIIDFLEQHAGAKSFFMTPPGSSQGLFTVESYSLNSVGSGLYSLSAEFTESFVL